MTTTCANRSAWIISSILALLMNTSVHAHSVDKKLLDVLLSNGTITQAQHQELVDQWSQDHATEVHTTSTPAITPDAISVEELDTKIAEQVAQQVDDASPIKASHGGKGFRFETRDGDWQTNLQWRGQLRYTNPSSGDPRL